MVATFASAKQFILIGKEVTQGTAVAGTSTIPVEKFEWEDKPVWLDDKAMRGSMVESYGRQTGVIKTDFSMSGPVFLDTLGFLLANTLGDISYTGGTPTGSPTTTTGALTAGVSTVVPVTSATGIVTGTIIQLDTAGLLENVTVLSVAALNVTLTAPVKFSHLTAAAVQPVLAPFNTVMSTLNSGNGQPGSHTLVHNFGPPASTGTRVLAGACLSEVTLKWNAETQLLTYDAKGSAYPTAISGVTPVSTPSAVTPVASWRGVLGIAGPASGGTQVKTVMDGEFMIKRALEPIFTTQNSQSPYIIQRGAVSTTGKLSFVAIDETPFTTMISNTQPQLQLVLSNALAGTSLASITVNCTNAAYETSKPNFGKAAIAYDTTFYAVANTTDAGSSGGYSPIKVTLANAVPPYTYL